MAGVVSNFSGEGISHPRYITLGSDGALYFTNPGNNSIGRITTSGVVSNRTGTGISHPKGITAGPAEHSGSPTRMRIRSDG